MKLELRVRDSELRANEDGSMTVSGYVNMTDQPSEILGQAKKFVEKIAKGAFSRSIISSEKDIDFLAEHNRSLILASTRNKSLELVEDEHGLFMSAVITPTSWGKDYYELINSKILRNMSFGFRTIKDEWKLIKPNLYERVIQELELFEVSVVKDPAYSQSTIEARGIDVIEDVTIPEELEEENRNMEEHKEALLALEKKFDLLISAVEEIRTMTEQNQKEPEVEKIEQPIVEQPLDVVEQEEVIEEVKVEEPEEKTEISESSEIEEEVKQEEPVQEELKTTPEEVTQEHTNLRSRLAALK